MKSYANMTTDEARALHLATNQSVTTMSYAQLFGAINYALRIYKKLDPATKEWEYWNTRLEEMRQELLRRNDS